MDAVVSAMVRSRQMEPFGLEVQGIPTDPRLAVIRELISLMERLVKCLENFDAKPARKDDFMKGWGEPGGDLE